MLKAIRRSAIANSLVRRTFKWSLKRFTGVMNFLIQRWPVYGVIDCHFGGHDFKMYNECDDSFPTMFFYDVKYEEDSDLRLFIALTRHAQTIVDIGANTGLYSILSSQTRRTADIYAIEPYSPNFKRLLINLKLNECSNVKTIQVAMGERVGAVEFTVPANNSISEVSSINGEFSKSVYPDLEWKCETISLETLDHIREVNKIKKIDLIKCDVETYEMNVFMGMDQILREDRPAVLFECFLYEERKVFFNEVLSKYNYHAYALLSEGIVYLSNGFEMSAGGLNYLLSPVPPSGSFLTYDQISARPESVLAL